MIIETSANQFYQVVDASSPDLSHLWWGIEVKRVKGEWVQKANKKWTHVRKAATRVVEG